MTIWVPWWRSARMSLTSPNETQFLCRAYGWPEGTELKELSSGENHHLLARTPEARFVVRRYRAGVRSAGEVEAELAWMLALKDALNVPEVVPNAQGELLTVGEAHVYAVFGFVEGDWLEPTPQSYRQLGHILRTLHDKAPRVAQSQPPTWPGWTRPHYGAERVISHSLESLLAAPFLTATDKAAFERLAGRLEHLWSRLPAEHSFIHADVHLGNVLEHGERYTLLDFDECGFGPRAFDVGAARLHPVAAGYLDEVWPAFLEGYGALDDGETRLGAALRFFYMMGKIPQRLDHPDLHNPGERLRRYLGYVEEELEPLA